MSRFDGRRFGTWSLRLDAAYCLILGLLVVGMAPQIATVIALPRLLLLATGVSVVAWAVLVLWMSARIRVRRALQIVLAVNIIATLLIATASVTAASAVVVLVVLATALEVALFAASQAIAIRALDAGVAAA